MPRDQTREMARPARAAARRRRRERSSTEVDYLVPTYQSSTIRSYSASIGRQAREDRASSSRRRVERDRRRSNAARPQLKNQGEELRRRQSHLSSPTLVESQTRLRNLGRHRCRRADRSAACRRWSRASSEYSRPREAWWIHRPSCDVPNKQC